MATLTQMFGDLEARRLGRAAEARDAYRAALGLAIPRPERAFVEGRLLAAQRVVTGGA